MGWKQNDFAFGAKAKAPFQPHSATSREAAEKISPSLNELQRRVFSLVVRSGEKGMTDEELIEESGLAASTVRPRRVELVSLGLVVDSGRTRPTHSGRKAAIWVRRV